MARSTVFFFTQRLVFKANRVVGAFHASFEGACDRLFHPFNGGPLLEPTHQEFHLKMRQMCRAGFQQIEHGVRPCRGTNAHGLSPAKNR